MVAVHFGMIGMALGVGHSDRGPLKPRYPTTWCEAAARNNACVGDRYWGHLICSASGVFLALNLTLVLPV